MTLRQEQQALQQAAIRPSSPHNSKQAMKRPANRQVQTDLHRLHPAAPKEALHKAALKLPTLGAAPTAAKHRAADRAPHKAAAQLRSPLLPRAAIAPAIQVHRIPVIQALPIQKTPVPLTPVIPVLPTQATPDLQIQEIQVPPIPAIPADPLQQLQVISVELHSISSFLTLTIQ